MAEKRVIELEVKTDKANKAINDLNKSTTDLAASFEDVYGEMQPLSGRMGELEDRLYELALAGKQNTQEYKELQSEVSRFKRVIMETDMAVDGASGTMSQKLSGALGGIASGFELAQGVMASFGVESAEVEEALLKVQSAMAISQGFAGLKEASNSFKALGKDASDAFGKMTTAGKAFAVTGIGLLITGLGLVITYWDDIKKAVGGVSEEEKKLAEFRRKHEAERRDFVAKESAGFAMALSQLKATNEGSKERSKLITEINQKYGTTLKNLSDEKAFQQQINDELKNYLAYQTAKFKLQANEEAIVTNLKTQSKLKQQLAEDEKKLTQLQSEGALKRKEGYEVDDMGRRISTGQTYANEQLAIQYEKTNKRIIENQKELAAAEKRFENYGKAALKAGSEISKLTDNGKKYSEQNKEIVKTTEKVTEEVTRNADEGVLKLQTAKAEEINVTNKGEESKYNYLVYWGNLTNDYYKDQRKKRTEEETKNREFAVQSAADTFNIITSLAQQSQQKYESLNKAVLDNDKLTDKEKQKLIDANNKRAKKAFEVQKAASIAAALVTTYQSAVSAYQSQFVPLPDPSSPIRGAIAAALAVATGLVNVKNIASQKFEGASLTPSSGGGGGSVPDSAGSTSAITPNFNIVGNAQATNPLAGLGGQPLQAYVVSGEVTTAQSLDRNRVNYATFG